MLTVWCVWWVDPAKPDLYSPYYVQRLQREVRAHLPRAHRFVCITDQDVPGVETVAPAVGWPGWWQKIALFAPGAGSAHNLFLDLDVVITGDLGELIDAHRGDALALPSNWANSGFGGCQSSVILWADCPMVRRIYEHFDPALAIWPPRHDPPRYLWGDQEFITRCKDQGLVQVAPVRAEWVRSYKYHCRPDYVPEGARLVVFHGAPKPPAVQGATWFRW